MQTMHTPPHDTQPDKQLAFRLARACIVGHDLRALQAALPTLNVNTPLEGDQTLLQLAAATESPKIVAVLLRAGAHVQAADSLGRTALHYAARANHPALCRQLCLAGAQLEASNWRGETPLMVAAHEGAFEAIRCLVDLGANRNTCNDLGVTLLHAAAGSSSLAICEYLLAIGLRASDVDDSDRAPRDYADSKFADTYDRLVARAEAVRLAQALPAPCASCATLRVSHGL